MASGTGEDHSEDFRPLEIAFPDEDVQRTGTLVTCSPADHHADPLTLPRAIELVRAGSNAEVQGRELFSASEIIHPVYQIKDDYGDRVKTGVFAQITTESHDAHPRVVIFGFSMISCSLDFAFPNSVRQKVEDHFERGDLVRTGRYHLTVITDDSVLHDLIVREFLTTGIRKWRNSESATPS